MTKNLLLLATCALSMVVGAPRAVNASTVNWGATIDNGLATSNGVALPQGDLVRLGYFTISNAAIRAGAGNLTLLNTSFVQYAAGAIGDGGLGLPGFFSDASINNDTSFAGHAIYYWVFNASSLASSTQTGIFTSTNTAFVFPSDTPVPGLTTTDIDQVDKNGNGIIVGSYNATGSIGAGGAPFYNLMAVAPEPGTYALFMLGTAAMSLVAFRKRVS